MMSTAAAFRGVMGTINIYSRQNAFANAPFSTSLGRCLSAAVDYGKFLTPVSSRRKPSAIRELQPLMAIPGMINLGAGLPNPDCFPFESIDVKLKTGETLSISDADAKAAFQYGQTPGDVRLIEWIKSRMSENHNISKDSSVSYCVTTGSQDALSKTFDMLVGEGDSVLTESPTYPGALACLGPRGCRIRAIASDKHGMIPIELANALDNWNSSDGPKPKVLYTIPCGQNPSGATYSLDRKKDILSICRQHDLLLLEDDPYYFLQFTEPTPSFLELDEDGRVLRFDSFSKVLSSGMRLGWASGPEPLVNRIQLHQQASTLHASSLSQLVLLSVLNHWGDDGWRDQVQKVKQEYLDRRDHALDCVRRHLGPKAEVDVPEAGMFLWMKLVGVEDTRELIMQRGVDAKVLFVPGTQFLPGGEPSSYVRASYSTATKEDIDVAFERLANML